MAVDSSATVSFDGGDRRPSYADGEAGTRPPPTLGTTLSGVRAEATQNAECPGRVLGETTGISAITRRGRRCISTPPSRRRLATHASISGWLDRLSAGRRLSSERLQE
jgi:hypothetical protein